MLLTLVVWYSACQMEFTRLYLHEAYMQAD